MTIKIEGGIKNLIDINNRSIKDGKFLAKKMYFDISKRVDAFELMQLIDKLAVKNFGLLYIFILNNSLKIIPLLINNLVNAN